MVLLLTSLSSQLLYSMDPDADPLACLLLIDFLAVRSSEFEFLLRFFHELDPAKNLSQLPNFAYSVALAQFHLELEKVGFNTVVYSVCIYVAARSLSQPRRSFKNGEPTHLSMAISR